MSKYETAEYQNSVRDFVSREVCYCVSHLVSELAGKPEYTDELMEVCAKPDYLESAVQYVPDLDREECVDLLESVGIECRDDEPIEDIRDAVEANLADETIDPVDFCDERGIDPEYREAFEHWIVSEWLANKLEEHGEMVIRDFLGLTIWGRATTGQAIYIDGVICDIYDELHK